jgi:hemolysin III
MNRAPSSSHPAKVYPPVEERLNIRSHVLGLILSLFGLLLLLLRSVSQGGLPEIFGAAVFGASLVALYAASTAYHRAVDPARRLKLRVVDHAVIYVLIAGTYTPFTLIVLKGPIGWTVFGVSWLMAVIGIVLKLFYTGRFHVLSTLMYVFMGWMIVFAIKPLTQNLSTEGLFWLGAGGLFYTVGAVIYSIGKIPFNHAIFHLFVLAGSICHFVSVYSYVLVRDAG